MRLLMLLSASIPARVGVVLVEVDFAVVPTIPSLTLPKLGRCDETISTQEGVSRVHSGCPTSVDPTTPKHFTGLAPAVWRLGRH
jgi:hypothetical protein